mmetsp:Transcript_1277/g.2504  ORF Transcript_1277/g.2504 Transcript_1277/m.2504 type:complete len:226 (-) Transcript_1277:51-728(-)
METNPMRRVRTERVSTFVAPVNDADDLPRRFSSGSPPRMANATASDRSISAALPNFPDSISPSMLSFFCSLRSVSSLPTAEAAWGGSFSPLFLFLKAPIFFLGFSFWSMHCGWKYSATELEGVLVAMLLSSISLLGSGKDGVDCISLVGLDGRDPDAEFKFNNMDCLTDGFCLLDTEAAEEGDLLLLLPPLSLVPLALFRCRFRNLLDLWGLLPASDLDILRVIR